MAPGVQPSGDAGREIIKCQILTRVTFSYGLSGASRMLDGEKPGLYRAIRIRRSRSWVGPVWYVLAGVPHAAKRKPVAKRREAVVSGTHGNTKLGAAAVASRFRRSVLYHPRVFE